MKIGILLCVVLAAVITVDARVWTDTQGRTTEAELIRVHPNRTVELKTPGGKTVTLPFSTFSAEDVNYLESALSAPAQLHEVSWEAMNKLFGLPLWKDNNLWDDPCREVARRTRLRQESSTEFLENYRVYPLGESELFGEPVYAVALYGTKEQTESLSLVFFNQGDVPEDSDPKEIEQKIEACGTRILEAIEPILGEPERDSVGRGDLREKVWRWDWNGHAVLLSLQEGKYVAVRIMPIERADRSGRVEKLSDDVFKARMADCVERRENGDVVIRNIPMIDQGPKGYCVPATWERYLRYVDIPSDMYLLALAAQTEIGGGTSTDLMIEATENILHTYGRKLSGSGSEPDLDTVSKQIDRGMPILWTLLSTPEFQRAANENTARRKGQTLRPAGQDEDDESGGHICLIIGYNQRTGEIAISDSWGPHFAERWVPVEEALEVSDGEMYYIKW
ncbi:MAG: C39 family peptidase [Pontiellaceae bacterium]|nr:C39 family peptidase [Pontiellaceae bacterium]